MRKRILIPVLALTAGLFLGETAQAQPPLGPPGLRPGPGPFPGPGTILRPPGPPRLGIGITIGAPIVRPPLVVVDPICEYYRVVYRDCAHDPWRTYRVYESHRTAHYVVDQLRDMGYEARVIHD